MLVNIHHDTPREHARLFVLGVVFTVVIAMLIALSLAIYNKVFEPATFITLKAEKAGLQLPKHGDVRQHGVLVGSVREVAQDGENASITVALKPEAVDTIDANINAAILPTTLFGQKFIELRDPERPAGSSIEEGAVVPASRVQTNVELGRVLTDLHSVLRAVNPADLNATLHALATALQGRGEEIGALIDDLDGYVTRFNRRLPTLREDLVLLARVARDYELATPELVRLMRNATVTARTLTDKEDVLGRFMTDLTGTARTANRLLSRNGEAMVRTGQLTVPIVSLLDTYSPEFPCLLKGLDRYTSRLGEIFAGGTVSQIMELDAKQRPVYTAQDKPVYGEVGHGPWCLGLPNPTVPMGGTDLANGSDSDANPEPPQ